MFCLKQFYKFILLFCVSFSLNLTADLATDTLYLTWQKSPSTTMTIQWLTPIEQTKTAVTYRQKKIANSTTPQTLSELSCDSPASLPPQTILEATGQSFKLPFSTHYLVHRVELKNLNPDTDYIFKIVPYEQEFGFHTAPSELPEKGICFVSGGDMYHDDIKFMNQTSQQAAKCAPLFALLGGDIAYAVESRAPTQKIDRWIDWLKSWHSHMVTTEGNLIPVIAAIGNHDLIGQFDQTPAQAAVFATLFPMPGNQIYNTLDFDSYLSLFILDSGHANSIAGTQTFWLAEALKTRKNVLYKLAIYHVPAYPSVRDYYNNSYSAAIRRHWVPLFESGGVQTVFEHHDHAYKRTFPLLKNQVHQDGIVYLGDGGWGVEKPRNPGKQRRNYLAKSLAARHFIVVTLTPIQQRFRAINDQGQVIDEYIKELK